TLSRQWSNFAFGKYTAYLDLSYGKSNQTATAMYSFFVFPWQLIVTLLIALIIALMIIKAGITHYNKWVIEQARKGMTPPNQNRS
ncbi:MAG: hypothetical protein QG669_363, partial [Patescibacteria group bacterium]|nr:hypothetical protein [Patescibacteria group bacterium]